MQQPTERERQFLIYLVEMSEPVTIKGSTEKENVGVWTIRYDLDDTGERLNERRQVLYSKRSQGTRMNISNPDRTKLKSESMDANCSEILADQNLRIKRLLIIFLVTEEAIIGMKMVNTLDASKNTTMNNLDVLENNFLKEGLTLSRQMRKGFWIIGEKRPIQLTIEEIFQKELTDYDAYRLMSLSLNGSETEYFKMYSVTITPIQEVFDQVITRMRYLLELESLEKLNYVELLNILIRVTTTTVRLHEGATIDHYQLVAEQEPDKSDLSHCVMQWVFDYRQLPLFEDGYHYIYGDTFDTAYQQNVMKLVRNVIYKTSRTINHFLYQDP